MASFKLGLYLLVSIFAFHLLPSPVFCGEEERNLLHDINIYRKVLNLPVLEKHSNPSCLAEEISDDLQGKDCEDFCDYNPAPGSNCKIPNFQENVKQCKININTTKDVIIMPVCVPSLDRDALFSNYTKSNRFTKYLNNSKYTIAGIGSVDDWMVLIISTNTSYGDLSSATSLLDGALKGHYLVLAFFLNLLVVLIN